MAFDGGALATRGVDFLDLQFSGLDLDAAVDAVAARASLDLPFAYVATPNVDHVVGLSNEPARRALYDRAWLLLNDSRILERLAKRAALTLPVATGADLAERLLDSVIDRHEPVTIIGGDREQIEALKDRYGLTDVRWHRAPAGLRNKPEAIVAAAAYAAQQPSRFTFVCVGAPQQELIAYAMRQHGGARGVGLCVGAALDFLSGRVQRAPLWMRRAGLEWLHRLASEPSRMWKRYLVTGPKVFSLFAAWRASMAA
ncbi:MAG TPA: WecB/TagA/CpsF family glycosyltransferase [Vitreimonas sp.]|uniref:WecB/TagA/CpsF family glycosyltransferase n=1 Tax=Vitreimonas sp. TaxID=3069702 RepID=UPI002D3C9C32|nr:WecB/TagA/CpsF family glycosyltransferase [Vitreimonas sp.]HYD86688.1 WecB/TagA/CpsF family glycosyltransferase [Vitreimonas sp.]